MHFLALSSPRQVYICFQILAVAVRDRWQEIHRHFARFSFTMHWKEGESIYI